MQWRITYVRKRQLNIRHDYREVTWSDSYIQFFGKPNFSEYLPNVPKCGLNTRHDNREVTWSDTYSIFPKGECVRIFIECSEVWIEHTTW